MTLYFDKNDEMVDEETAMRDPFNYYHKYHAVTVDFGGEDYGNLAAAHKITKDIFYGEKRTENAQIFIDKMQKAKAIHQKKLIDQEFFPNISNSEDSLSEIGKGVEAVKMKGENLDGDLFDSVGFAQKGGDASTALNESGVIMDINPRKFEKQKDNLFFDFFSLYTKNFIDDKGGKARNPKQQQTIDKLKKMMGKKQ